MTAPKIHFSRRPVGKWDEEFQTSAGMRASGEVPTVNIQSILDRR